MNEYRLKRFTFREASPATLLNAEDRIVAVLDHQTVVVGLETDHRILALVEHDTRTGR